MGVLPPPYFAAFHASDPRTGGVCNLFAYGETMCISFFRRGAALAAAVATTFFGAAGARGQGAGEPRQDPGRGVDAWLNLDRLPPAVLDAPPNVRPLAYRAVMLDLPVMQAVLSLAPQEGLNQEGVLVSMPMPDGGSGTFALVETHILHPDLGKQYPEIRTYSGVNLTPGPELGAPGAFDLTPTGFRGSIRTART